MARSTQEQATRDGMTALAQAEVYASLAAHAEEMLADAVDVPLLEAQVTLDVLRTEIDRLRRAEGEMLRDAKRHGVIS